jgi:hypothetical protein
MCDSQSFEPLPRPLPLPPPCERELERLRLLPADDFLDPPERLERLPAP